jgi:hypothetical protein
MQLRACSDHVVEVITHNASICKQIGKTIEERFFFTSNTTHMLELCLRIYVYFIAFILLWTSKGKNWQNVALIIIEIIFSFEVI